jgi:hypothetical protein
MIDLKAIEERCEKATKGPWELEVDTEYISPDEPESGQLIFVTGLERSMFDTEWAEQVDWDKSLNNADFIAHSREDLPALLEAVKEAREIIGPDWCRCEMRIGNPMVKTHSPKCLLAKAWMAKMGGEK